MSVESTAPIKDEDTMKMDVAEPSSEADLINKHITSHPLVVALLEDSTFTASRPHLKTPAGHRPYNLMNGVLLGDDRIPVPPLAFVKPDGSKYYSFLYIGPGLCGHPGFVHGGLLSTLMDEGLAGACFPALPNKAGVTVSLKVDFKKPCASKQYVVIKAETTKVDGRKAWVKGTLESLKDEGDSTDAEVMVEAEALFIDPR